MSIENQFDSNGMRCGLCKAYYTNGDLHWEFNYVDGEIHGLCRVWHFKANGYLAAEGMYANDMQNGFWKVWDRLGRMSNEHHSIDGVQEGEEIRHIYD